MAQDLQELYDRSHAADFGTPIEEFERILDEMPWICPKAAVPRPERIAFYRTLHLKDLMLARACLAGSEQAWEILVRDYRHKLFAMSQVIAKDEGHARELSDSLFAELFGVRERLNGNARSKLSYYTGRASLEVWLRALLAQEYVNRFRTQRRFVEFQETEAGCRAITMVERESADPALEKALDNALAELNAEQRFLLAGHYLDGRSFTELSRMLMVHETTIGRRMEKALKTVRKRTLHHLRCSGMSMRAAEETFHCDIRDLAIDVRRRLIVGGEA